MRVAEESRTDRGIEGRGSAAAQNRGFLTSSSRIWADCVVFADLTVLLGAAFLAQEFYLTWAIGGVNVDWLGQPALALVGTALCISLFRLRGLYEPERLKGVGGQIGPLVGSWATALLVTIAFMFLTKTSAQFSRGWLVSWALLAPMGLFAVRAGVALRFRAWARSGRFARRVAVVGAGSVASQLCEQIDHDGSAEVVGIYDEGGDCTGESRRPVHSIDELISDARRGVVDEIVMALQGEESERTLQLLEKLSVLPTAIRLCPPTILFKLPTSGISPLGRVPLFNLLDSPLQGWNGILKRLEDCVLGGLLLVGISPLLVLTAIAIKLDSHGPVFFRQRRHGFNENEILVWKFRTMRSVEKHEDFQQARRDDDRVTRVGRYLRRLSLDELPQLFNVIRGEMSLIGPRPHHTLMNDEYEPAVERYLGRHRVKPGITGWAQVNGYRGEITDPAQMQKRVECDLNYIENWSLWFDFKILLLTLFRGFRHPNAY
jgi:putative colanic acid biosynthesis UDP-glucose lipid carrier transferase